MVAEFKEKLTWAVVADRARRYVGEVHILRSPNEPFLEISRVI